MSGRRAPLESLRSLSAVQVDLSAKSMSRLEDEPVALLLVLLVEGADRGEVHHRPVGLLDLDGVVLRERLDLPRHR